MPTLRAVPASDPAAARNSHALHGILAAAYFLPALPCAFVPGLWGWLPLALALLARAALFDVALNAGEGRPWLAVGSTANWDNWLRRLAPGRPERLAGLVRAACLVLYIVLVVATSNLLAR